MASSRRYDQGNIPSRLSEVPPSIHNLPTVPDATFTATAMMQEGKRANRS